MQNLNSLKKLISKHFTKENAKFFYSFEVSPKSGFEIDFNKLHIKPLFVDITWISDHNLNYKQIELSPAFQLKDKLKSSVNVVNSVTCYKLNDDHIDQMIDNKKNEKNINFTILRGDNVDETQKYAYASELISEIRSKTRQREDDVTIFAAGQIENLNSETDMQNLKRKVDAGVDVILTQLTFSAENFCKFVTRCREIKISDNIPIIPGLYIPRNMIELKLLLNITKVSLPHELQNQLEHLQNDEVKFQDQSLSFIINLIKDIQRNSPEHVKGFHFFTMNNLTMLNKLTEKINFSEI